MKLGAMSVANLAETPIVRMAPMPGQMRPGRNLADKPAVESE
jgi:hypothetical protein